MFRKVLVANRGEIAIRVMRACRELDIRTVAIYSDADTDAAHVRYADEAYRVGPRRPAESYLDMDAILDVAARADADAIHPGYGFLAENADFAERVEESAATWVGPESSVMRHLGTKTGARQTMSEADVPIVPGTTDPVEEPDEIAAFGEEHGYPIAIKADAGGGGRGMVVVNEAEEIEEALEQAAREGEAYFDDATVYLEKFLPAPRHVEVQLLGDSHGNVRHLGERDCSLQRRQQKVIEEAPAPGLDPDLRAEITAAAVRGAESAGYTNAGTAEFLVWDDEFYFMELNTRIQVEHPVSECITGIDIVKWQLRIAAGEEIGFTQEAIDPRGHAMEFRINAEAVDADFAPVTGTVETYHPPGGIGIRVDDGVARGDEVGGDYDSMIAKLIIHASDREECFARAERALTEYDIQGLRTIVPFHRLMLTDKRFIEATHSTRYLDDEIDPERLDAAVERWGSDGPTGDGAPPRAQREFTVEVDGKRFAVDVTEHGAPAAESTSEDTTSQAVAADTGSATVAGTSGEEVTAEMQGTVLSVEVEDGETVEAGDVLCVIEAMKMENDVVASGDGTVTSVPIEVDDSVDMGDVLCVIE